MKNNRSLIKFALLVLMGSAVCAAGAAVTRGSCAFWPEGDLHKVPATWPVDDAAISNNYGRIDGVKPIWIEGAPWRGRKTRVFAWWGLPKGASPTARVPAMVLVHGGGGTAFARWVKIWNDRGYAAIAMDTCGKAPRGERDGRPHPTHAWSGPEGWGPSVKQVNEPIEDQWTYHAVMAVARCHSFLRSRSEVDAEKTGLTGISWGGYLTAIVMGVDRRFKFAAPVYGCGYYDLNPEWCRHMRGEGPNFARWIALWDPRHYIGGARCPVLWCDGTNDHWYTLEMLRLSCDLVAPATPLSLALKLRMPHGHGAAGDPREITACADHYLKGKGRLPRIDSAKATGRELRVAFTSFGQKIARGELLATCSTNAVLEKREWRAMPVTLPEGDGKAVVTLPEGVQAFFFNLVTESGLVVSSRVMP